MNIICLKNISGSLVIYYNNRMYFLYFDGYFFYVYNEFCEVEVYCMFVFFIYSYVLCDIYEIKEKNIKRGRD